MNLTDCRHNGVDQQQERAPRQYYGANATRKNERSTAISGGCPTPR
jgi:hypothetical protein